MRLLPLSPSEREAHVTRWPDGRRRVRRCRGPRTRSVEEVLGLLSDRAASLAKHDAQKASQLVMDMVRIAETARAVKQDGESVTVEAILRQDLIAVHPRAAKLLDHWSREKCGRDPNPVILAHPLDGRPRWAVCECGVRWTWTPARLEPWWLRVLGWPRWWWRFGRHE